MSTDNPRLAAAIDAINAFIGPNPDPSAALIAAKCRGLLAGYDFRWGNVPLQVEAVEYLIQSDLWNPETGRKSRSFTVAGKVDARLRDGNRTIIVDHKTTSEDISDPNGPYWRQLVVEAQPTHYMLLEWLNGRKIDGAMWDVIRKPGISPKEIKTKREQSEILQFGQYFGRVMSHESLTQLAASGRETLEMYEARLAHDCGHERPQWFFQRRPVPRLDSEILDYARELWEHGQEMLHVRNTERYARNSGACMLYKSPCKYLGICSGHDTVDSDNWTRVACVHRELPLEGDGRDVLTNSRIRCFQTCRRKEYFTYELGLERQDEEEREALYFGSCWHAGQEAWWGFGLAAEAAEVVYEDAAEAANKGDIPNGNASSDSATEVECAYER